MSGAKNKGQIQNQMKKSEKLIVVLATVLSFAAFALQFAGIFGEEPKKAGNIVVDENAYSSSTVYTSSSLTGNLATLVVPKATSTRTYAQVCLSEAATSSVWVYKQGTSTGIVVGGGEAIYPSSSAASKPCLRVDANDPYYGEIWVITRPTGTVVNIDYSQGLTR